MPKIRELVIDGEIIKNIPRAVEKFGGNYWLLYYTLRNGEHLYLGHHVEYLRKEEEPPEPEPCNHEPLDRKLKELCKPKPKRKKRFPLLASRHVTTNFGLYRDQLIYR